jgi:hypothetical protein
VRGTTEAINLIAKTWGACNVGEGDEIIVSHLEHHANIVPWQQLAAQGREAARDSGRRQRARCCSTNTASCSPAAPRSCPSRRCPTRWAPWCR